MVASYSASLIGEGRQTVLNATFTAGPRGIGSETDVFDNRRFNATPNFMHARIDISHTQDGPGGMQFFVKAQGQAADQPLVSSEQYSLGGLDSVRGYAESEVLNVRESNSRPTQGIVTTRTRAFNEDGKQVMEFTRNSLVYKRGNAPGDVPAFVESAA